MFKSIERRILAIQPARRCFWVTCQFFVVVAIIGCAGTKGPMVPMARIEGAKRPYFAGQILAPTHNLTLTYSELVNRLSRCNIVFIGEVHDNPDHHLIQLQLLQSLRERWGHLTLAVEFLPAQSQPILNEYLEGDISEQDFLRKVDWPKVWGFDYHFYRPLVDFQRINGDPISAINAPHAVVRKVAKNGLKSLSKAERDILPKEIDLTDKEHRAYLREVYRSHPHKRVDNFEFFYQAQCVWEETMAENIARLISNGINRVVVICGNGHIFRGLGIPKRLLRRIKLPVATVMPFNLGQTTLIKRDIADYVWLTGRYFPLSNRHKRSAETGEPENNFDKRETKN